MKLYLLSQNENDGYDTYDSCVVCAENAEDAVTIAPDGDKYKEGGVWCDWAQTADNVICAEIGEANENQERGVIVSSFNAG